VSNIVRCKFVRIRAVSYRRSTCNRGLTEQWRQNAAKVPMPSTHERSHSPRRRLSCHLSLDQRQQREKATGYRARCDRMSRRGPMHEEVPWGQCHVTHCACSAILLLSRDHNCDSTTIRLRHDDTTTHSTTTEMIEITSMKWYEITIRLRYDYDKTTTKNWHVNFLLAWNGNRRVRASWSYRSRVVAYITIAIRLRQDYDTSYTTIPRRIRLRRKWSKLRFDCDTTTTR